MRHLLSDTRMPRTDWSVGDLLAIELIGQLELVRPKRILEVGSGFSTAILAAYAAEHGAEVVTLEHLEEYHARTADGLRNLGLDSFVDLRLAELRQQYFGGHGPYRWYDTSLKGDFDFVFVDGPPKSMGRQGVFFAVDGHLRPGWRMLLDDGLRRHEKRCLKLWEQHFPGRFSYERVDLGRDSKGVFVLGDARDEHDHRDRKPSVRQTGIGTLRAGDQDWWRRAWANVGEKLLESVHVVATGAEEPFQRRIREFRVAKELAGRPNVRYLLYLDDRWSPCTIDETWLRRALDILEEQPDVGQVSLLHQIELTGINGSRPIAGTPSLRRVDRKAADDAELQPQTVHLWPGVFRRSDDQAGGPATGHPWVRVLEDETGSGGTTAATPTRSALLTWPLALGSNIRIGLLLVGLALGLMYDAVDMWKGTRRPAVGGSPGDAIG